MSDGPGVRSGGWGLWRGQAPSPDYCNKLMLSAGSGAWLQSIALYALIALFSMTLLWRPAIFRQTHKCLTLNSMDISQ